MLSLLLSLLLSQLFRGNDAATVVRPAVWRWFPGSDRTKIGLQNRDTGATPAVRRSYHTLKNAAGGSRAVDSKNRADAATSTTGQTPSVHEELRRSTIGVPVASGSDSTPLPLPSPPTRAPRVYLHGSNLHVGQIVQPTAEQTRYLLSVMRLRDGSPVRVFDGVNGEFLATVFSRGGKHPGDRSREKRSGGGGQPTMELRVDFLTRRQPDDRGGVEVQDGFPPDVELIFAPIRKQRLKMLVEKAVEIGASRLTPVLTARTQRGAVADANAFSKLGAATVVEAAEQCERMTVPPVTNPVKLTSLLGDINLGAGGRLIDIIFVCKERDADAPPLLEALAVYAREAAERDGQDCASSDDGGTSGVRKVAKAAFLVGPEGGFDPDEMSAMAEYPFVRFVSLGSNVLRAETAAVYALSSWSAFWAAHR
ncbi:unnamed protein product [Scytosiphon promiscuus]